MGVAGFEKGIKDVKVLQKALGIADYGEFAELIHELVEQGKLKPTKNGRETNGKYPPLARKYRIVEEVEDWSEVIRDIKVSFPLAYEKNYYQLHPDQYVKDKVLIDHMIAYHKRTDSPLATSMSLNERLFDMFRHEKSLSVSGLETILRRLGLNLEYLNIYETPEPFIYYSEAGQGQQRILIVENKDTWYTLRKLKMEGVGLFDSLIYGEGKKILRSCEELGQHQLQVFNSPDNVYYYWGDLDDEGLGIYDQLRVRMNDKGLTIKLWEEAYHRMVDDGMALDCFRFYKAQRSLGSEILHELLEFLSDNQMEATIDRFRENMYVPQEILNYGVLKDMTDMKK